MSAMQAHVEQTGRELSARFLPAAACESCGDEAIGTLLFLEDQARFQLCLRCTSPANRPFLQPRPGFEDLVAYIQRAHPSPRALAGAGAVSRVCPDVGATCRELRRYPDRGECAAAVAEVQAHRDDIEAWARPCGECEGFHVEARPSRRRAPLRVLAAGREAHQ